MIVYIPLTNLTNLTMWPRCILLHFHHLFLFGIRLWHLRQCFRLALDIRGLVLARPPNEETSTGWGSVVKYGFNHQAIGKVDENGDSSTIFC